MGSVSSTNAVSSTPVEYSGNSDESLQLKPHQNKDVGLDLESGQGSATVSIDSSHTSANQLSASLSCDKTVEAQSRYIDNLQRELESVKRQSAILKRNTKLQMSKMQADFLNWKQEATLKTFTQTEEISRLTDANSKLESIIENMKETAECRKRTIPAEYNALVMVLSQHISEQEETIDYLRGRLAVYEPPETRYQDELVDHQHPHGDGSRVLEQDVAEFTGDTASTSSGFCFNGDKSSTDTYTSNTPHPESPHTDLKYNANCEKLDGILKHIYYEEGL